MPLDAVRSDRLKANLASLAGHVDAELLAAMGDLATTGKVPPPDGMPADPAARQALAQAVLRHYRANPVAITFNDLGPVKGGTHLSHRMVREIFDRAVDGAAIDEQIVPEHGPLICFGIGAHIAAFLGEYRTRDLFVLDPNIGAFCQDLIETDWTSIVAEIDRRGGSIRFIWSEDPILLAMAAIEIVRADSFPLIDGARLVMGYSNQAVGAVSEAFIQRRDSLISYNGYLEDEAALYRYAFWNMAGHQHYLLDRDIAFHTDMPAVIVGSGFSLNQHFDALRAVADKVCIVSCGTALLPLLEHGIRPDIHCELESVEFIRDILAYTASLHDLSGIVLAASNTVAAGVADHFDRKIFIFREGTAAARILSPTAAPLPLIAPACTNTGIRVAYALGFRELYLMGLDLGSRTQESHHADGSVYGHIEAYNEFVGENGRKIPPRGSATGAYNREVEANFGGTVLTNPHMLHMRTVFEMFARAMPDTRLFNFSDGAAISGFTPSPVERLRAIPVPSQSPASVLDQALASIPFVEPKQNIDRDRILAFKTALEHWMDEARARLRRGFDRTGDGRADIQSLIVLFEPLLMTSDFEANAKDIPDTCRYVHTGTLLKPLHFARYAASRMSAGDAARVVDATIEVLDRVFDDFREWHLYSTVQRSLDWLEADPETVRAKARLGWPKE